MQLCALAAASLRLGQRPRPGRPFLRSWPNGIGMGAWCQPDSAGNPWKSHRGCWGRGFPGCQTGPTGRVTPHGRNAPLHGARRHTALSPSPSLCPGSCPSWRPLSMVKCARPMLPLSGKLSSSCCPGRTAPPNPPARLPASRPRVALVNYVPKQVPIGTGVPMTGSTQPHVPLHVAPSYWVFRQQESQRPGQQFRAQRVMTLSAAASLIALPSSRAGPSCWGGDPAPLGTLPGNVVL